MPRMLMMVALVAVVVYTLVWLAIRLRNAARPAPTSRPAPDDDPEFLAELDRRLAAERRRRERERAQQAANAAKGVEPAVDEEDHTTRPAASQSGTSGQPGASTRPDPSAQAGPSQAGPSQAGTSQAGMSQSDPVPPGTPGNTRPGNTRGDHEDDGGASSGTDGHQPPWGHPDRG